MENLNLRNIKNFVQYGLFQQTPEVPLLLIFDVTTRCDLACLHCSDDVWGDHRSDLSLDEIRTFSVGLGEIERIGIGGGEPFLRKDLVEICKLFADNNKVDTIFIPSNGFATNSILATIRKILDQCPHVKLKIMLSLDGFEETHDQLRDRPGSFKKLMNTAHQIKDLSKNYPKLSLGSFNSTINNRNFKELPLLAKFLREEFQVDLTFSILCGTPRDTTLKVPSKEELEETLDGLLNVPEASLFERMRNKVYRDVMLRSNFEDKQIVPCRAGSLAGLVYANGEVHACQFLPSMGNVRKKSFKEIWNSPKARAQVASIKRGECACNSVCNLGISIMSYWKLPYLMIDKYLKQLLNFSDK